jgi:hypothetical protein
LERVIEEELQGGEIEEDELLPWYDEDDLHEVIKDLFRKYYIFSAMMLEYKSIAYVTELYDSIMGMHRAFAKFVTKQQDLHPNSSSLIAHQLVLCCNWKNTIQSFEQEVFSFARVPCILQVTRDEDNFPLKLYLPTPPVQPTEMGRDRHHCFFNRETALQILESAKERVQNNEWAIEIFHVEDLYYNFYDPIKVIQTNINQLTVMLMSMHGQQNNQTDRSSKCSVLCCYLSVM